MTYIEADITREITRQTHARTHIYRRTYVRARTHAPMHTWDVIFLFLMRRTRATLYEDGHLQVITNRAFHRQVILFTLFIPSSGTQTCRLWYIQTRPITEHHAYSGLNFYTACNRLRVTRILADTGIWSCCCFVASPV